MPIGVGVVGCGRIGRGAHLPGYARTDQARIVAICDLDQNTLEQTLTEYPEAFGYTCASELLMNPAIDAVSICTPNDSHMALALEAISRGKHVLCEKPLALNPAQARVMAEEADRSGLIHMVSFTHRFNPTMVYIKELLAEDRLGDLYHIRVRCCVDRLMNPDVPLEWRHRKEVTSGAVADLGSHMLDLATFLMGEGSGPVIEVSGATSIFTPQRRLPDGLGWGDVTAEDAGACILRYQKGTLGIFELSRFSPSGVHIEIDGSLGSVIYDSSQAHSVSLLLRGQGGYQTHMVTDSFCQDRGLHRDMFANQISHFVRGVCQGQRVKPDFSDGLSCQQTIEAILCASDLRPVHSWEG